jgi:DNA-binding MarR family transcriptional regulator
LTKPDKTDLLTQELAQTFTQFRRQGPPKSALHGIKPGEFFLLTTLINSIPPGADGLKASDLSNRMQVTPAAVTHLINDLEKSDYVERVSDPSDRRIVLIRPTEAGLKMMEVANAQFLDNLKGLVEFLGEDDSREFIRLIALAMTYFKNKMDALKEQEE